MASCDGAAYRAAAFVDAACYGAAFFRCARMKGLLLYVYLLAFAYASSRSLLYDSA